MRALLIYPAFPKSFWSFEKFLELVSRKVLFPPLGLVTVAAILPQEWEFKLVDCNIREITEPEWAWADIVIISAMIVQKEDFLAQIKNAKLRGKPVAVGGPYPTSIPEDSSVAGADYLVLDEGEITIEMFIKALESGEKSGVFRSNGEKPDVTKTPIPRYDLLELNAYQYMSIQFSRGCPFQCEFCDIIVLYGRKPRTKNPAQVLAELEYLYSLGWRGGIFMVDDNFIGNKRNVKLLLEELKIWQANHDYPFNFYTEASVDLAQDSQLMESMVECGFNTVFLGIETPDAESLQLTKKFQNTRSSLEEGIDKITRAGLIPVAGFILGFDGEKPGAGSRIAKFIETTGISRAFFTLLQALPNTALWHRLEKENRLLSEDGNINQTTLTNFIPTRPIEEIAQEYIDAFWELYDAQSYLDRTYKCFSKLGISPIEFGNKKISMSMLRGLFIILWRQGVKRKTRYRFWHYLFSIIRRDPKLWTSYITVCGSYEHFAEYRSIVRKEIQEKLAKMTVSEEQNSKKLTGINK
ncbi:B12-binding domain-containing radical SAM protein [Dulcicalothrix desertica PCC 7102]|uniref:B12-binding domain-containing radical SAM protein n=1 Tax=Dulcicalothrix desertica PCC 7102 TaxID=232991 RepID=A0A3S1CQC8_9CYAN|nr:B12-binding domain-containing radical SAM protein [Dulcicalothrix desertica]RUT07242.1 B12-binding domain-containing radical SAM protein [Dulcicalothrix desertica PCC 7102]TWH61764.1 radical SAM superfamily enzyme YgiQ (UPF0313 family) [Dulcicalothrix desertica PCC 7102]